MLREFKIDSHPDYHFRFSGWIIYTFTILPSLRDWGRYTYVRIHYHTAVPTGLLMIYMCPDLFTIKLSPSIIPQSLSL